MVFSSVTFVLVFLPCVLLIYFSLYTIRLYPRLSICLFFASLNAFIIFIVVKGWPHKAAILASLAFCLVQSVILFKTFPNLRRCFGIPLCNAFLFLASLFFYAWGEPRAIVLLLSSTFLNYLGGLLLRLSGGDDNVRAAGGVVTSIFSRRKQIILFFTVAVNLFLLGYCKYADFFLDNGGRGLFSLLLPDYFNVSLWKGMALPLGISFYTFQGISYLIDVYRGQTKATFNIINFGCYLTMFPQLVAGPIVRYASIAWELRNRSLSLDTFVDGSSRFVMGLAKKLLIADTLGRTADIAFALPASELPLAGAWIGAIFYSLQIYFDFSGYSDMAIGMGKMFGFTFPENFNYPYISQSIKEFWRRWHMTLSGWFRDYLYIPLGGNRKGETRTIINLLIVFLLCGLWHGAAWTFLLWGAWHGMFLMLERLCPHVPTNFPRALRHIYALLIVLCGWVLFRSADLSHCLSYFAAMCGFYEMGVETNRLWQQLFCYDTYIAFLLGVVLSCPVFPRFRSWLDEYQRKSTMPGCAAFTCAMRLAGVLVLLLICLMPLFGATYNAFIYFRF